MLAVISRAYSTYRNEQKKSLYNINIAAHIYDTLCICLNCLIYK